MSKWVEFWDNTETYPNASKKTRTWIVWAKSSSFMLGTIKWYGPWRQYCFYPKQDSLYNAECLEDIAKFCRDNRDVRNELVQ